MTLDSQLTRYLVIGSLITLADAGLYSCLTGRDRPLGRITANIISTTLGMLLGFSLHFVLVFQPQVPHLPARLLAYAVTVGCSVYIVQNLVIHCCAGRFRLSPAVLSLGTFQLEQTHMEWLDRMGGKLLAAAAGMIWNFLAFKYFVYA